MNRKPNMAFILAAGMGTRLRPYTDTIPKPMVEINGKSIIHRTIEKLKSEGVTKIVVNVHHLADVLKNHLLRMDGIEIIISHEDVLLDTGGGIKRALYHFNDAPFYIINGDALWDDKNPCALSRLSGLWDDSKMDILLMLQPQNLMPEGFVGDYDCANNIVTRNLEKQGFHMFAGVRIAHPRIFDESPDGAFSFLTLMDAAQSKGQLHGMIHDDAWYHISTPRDLETVNQLFQKRES
jgi:N-acetyl-alpha-D-muramate 1-phosphate uridylyltransferase